MKTRTHRISTVPSLLLCLFAAGGIAPLPALADSPGTAQRLADADNAFGFRMLDRLVEASPGKNVFLSPTSIALALTITYIGGGGETQAAMARVLGLEGMSLSEVNAGNAALTASLAEESPKVELAIANSLWADRRQPLRPDFVERCREAYRAELRNIHLWHPAAVPKINSWVRKNTRGKIDGIFKPGELDANSVLVLVNAVYFKGAWLAPFDKALTQDAPFFLDGREPEQVPLMSQTGSYPYYEDETMQAVRLTYGDLSRGYVGVRYGMVVFLPKAKDGLAEVRRRLGATPWQEQLSRLHSRAGTIRLPRFRTEYAAELKKTLTDLGMGVAFTPGADFRGICPPPLGINRVRHKTYLEVNEEGTTAAGVTSIDMSRGIDENPPPPFRMTVDHPFLCAIEDSRTGALLFLGVIMDP